MRAHLGAAGPGRSRGSLARRLSQVPPALASLLGVVAVLGVTWALLVPAWQSPDEVAHYAYAESLATRLALPGTAGRGEVSSSQLAADSAVGASRIAFAVPEARPNWSASADRTYRAGSANLSRTDGGGPNPAAVNPPLFYAYAGVAYSAAVGGDAFDRLYAMRLASVALLLATVVGAWLLAGEVLGRRRLAQLACAAVVGLEPMTTHISTSVTPDAMMITLWTFALWLIARVIVRGALRRDALALCAVTAAAILTKATSYALLPAVCAALLLGWRRRPAGERRGAIRLLLPAAATLVLPVILWLATATALGRSAVNTVTSAPGIKPRPFLPRQFLSYLWQYYLPRLPGMHPIRISADLPLWDVWIQQGWGAFGWLDVRMTARVYEVLAAVTGAVAVAAGAILVTFRDRLRLILVGIFALALGALLAGLHVTDYRSWIAGNGPVIQGRYALPLIGLLGLAVGLVVTRLPARARGVCCGVLLASLLVLQVLAIATVARTYYT